MMKIHELESCSSFSAQRWQNKHRLNVNSAFSLEYILKQLYINIDKQSDTNEANCERTSRTRRLHAININSLMKFRYGRRFDCGIYGENAPVAQIDSDGFVLIVLWTIEFMEAIDTIFQFKATTHSDLLFSRFFSQLSQMLIEHPNLIFMLLVAYKNQMDWFSWNPLERMLFSCCCCCCCYCCCM